MQKSEGLFWIILIIILGLTIYTNLRSANFNEQINIIKGERECKWVEHDSTSQGIQACGKKDGKTTCEMTVVELQEVFFKSKNNNCQEIVSKDFETLTFNCAQPVSTQTNFDSLNAKNSNGAAKCLSGGYLDTDHWSTIAKTKTLCCTYLG